MTLTKRVLAQRVSAQLGIPESTAREVVGFAIAAVAAHLAIPGNRVEFRGLGSMRAVLAAPRTGRNPRKPHERIVIPSRLRLKFHQSKLY